MAVNFATQTVTSFAQHLVSSMTFAYISPVTTNTALYVTIGCGQTNALVTSVSYAGVQLTKVAERFSTSHASTQAATIWRRLAPSTGTNNIIVIGDGGAYDFEVGAFVLDNVNQTTPERSTTAAFNDNASSPALITYPASSTNANDIIIAVACAGSALSAANKTQRWIQNFDGGSAGGNAAGQTAPGSSAAVTLSWTVAGPDNWRMAAASVQQVAAGGGTFFPPFCPGDLDGLGTSGRFRNDKLA